MDNVNSNVIKALNDLVETARDGQKGYETAAEAVQDPRLKTEFHRFAQQRSTFLTELENTARQLGGSTQDTTTVEGVALQAAGAVHRGWINLKSAIGANDSKAILSECENGDEAALKAYDNALQEKSLPVETLTIIQRQKQEIQAAKQTITSLKQGL
ncbi:PA2169 family four-helix-bundle protein [Rufibacter latericius]|uniref:PA2169 family four-helix-bundle protein n=1 Tax=Rufibacter latericius TaxID=2487040 RepID=A0A3M9MMU5_9BACT|nr:PA2169 family four-helix-bundle protein [Rufibacter latericius]RNI26525.1 PA2169 family four-helix-bundle protein [Rufibacter latericius]